MSTLSRAIEIAVAAHAGQIDKAGAPYILHPLRVMLSLETDVERIVGVLHDVVEDCPDWTMDRLRSEGFSPDILTALAHVTKLSEAEDYVAFIARAAQNPVARRVKRADLLDNLDVRRLPVVSDKDAKRLSKYLAALQQLDAVNG
ncbi:MAG: phosphohydrolase [Tabrizicola sp.]|jgi:(p)ppGpp synthase/HD superfamily hydrolase|nr:phosphohydrolase [Tabrizicola sp.]